MTQTLQGLRAGSYGACTNLKLSEKLSSFPEEILSLASTLEHLDLSSTGLSTIPESISQLSKLCVVFFSNCRFVEFPDLSQCPALEMVAFKDNGMERIPEGTLPKNLRWLILTNNKIDSLPHSIGECTRLQKCMLAGNQLRALPDEMAQCRKLCLLRLSGNRIESLPSWLWTMPELAFLAFASNPCAPLPSAVVNPALADFAWQDLGVTSVLGEGASGIIYKGSYGVDGGQRAVAVKVFKGSLTSDGQPEDEMAACIAAGTHPNLIAALGKIQEHPEGKDGVVFEMMDMDHYKVLGLPPSLQSCTRDTYPPSMTLSLGLACEILRGVCQAAIHLHKHGISHGDLYAHNIFYYAGKEGRDIKLGDFGAATRYGLEHPYAKALEAIEVLAFGHLIEDLMSRVNPGSPATATIRDAFLTRIHPMCGRENPTLRPSFQEIADMKGM